MSTSDPWANESNFQSDSKKSAADPWAGEKQTKTDPWANSPVSGVEQKIKQDSAGDSKLEWEATHVAGIESSMGQNIKTSPTGAVGVMQIKPTTAAQYGFDPTKLSDPDYNITVGTQILRKLLKEANGNRVRAAIMYNQGEGFKDTPYAGLPSEGKHYADLINEAIEGDAKSEQAKKVVALSPFPRKPELSGFVLGDPTKTPAYKGFTELYMGTKEAMDEKNRDPVTTFFDVIQAGGRGVESLAEHTFTNEDPENGWAHPLKTLAAAGHAFMTPDDHDKVLHGLERGVAHSLGFTSYEPQKLSDIDLSDKEYRHPVQFMEKIGQFALDTSVDVALDPMTYFDAVGILLRGAQAIRVTAGAHLNKDLMKMVVKGLGEKNPAFAAIIPELNKWSAQSVRTVQIIGDGMKWLGARRPDLDNFNDVSNNVKSIMNKVRFGGGFTGPYGKFARMAIENGEHYASDKRTEEYTKLLQKYRTTLDSLHYGEEIPQDIQRYLLMMPWKYGDMAARHMAEMHLANLGIKVTQEEAKAFPHPLGLFKYGDDLQNNFISAIMPKNLGTHVPPQVIKAYTWLKENAPKTGMPFTKAITSELGKKYGEAANQSIGQQAVQTSEGDPEALAGLPHAASVALKGAVQEGWKDTPLNMGKYIAHTLTLYNEMIDRENTAMRTAKLYHGLGSDFVHGVHIPVESLEATKDWFSKRVQNRSSEFSLKFGDAAVGSVLRGISNYYKAGITFNPLPHGLNNMGIVELFRYGPFVAAKGMRYALTGVPKELDERMEALGVKSAFWRDAPAIVKYLDIPWYAKKLAHLGSALPEKSDLESYFQLTQKLMDHLETGWRAAALEHLDKTWGVLPKDSPHHLLLELAKAGKLDTDLGPYANPTRIVSMFKAVGGLYNTFRFDVVPRAFLHALKSRGIAAIETLGHTENNFSEQFTPGQREHMFPAMDDPIELFLDPVGYSTKVASVGPVIGGQIKGLEHRNSTYQTGFQQDLWALGDYIGPGVGDVDTIINPFGDNNAPEWVRIFGEAGLGWHGQRYPRPQTAKRRHRGYVKAEDR